MTGRICGTGSYVPARIVENDELANLVDTNDAWIRERTGIARRHLAENETTSYMAAEAAKRALAQSDIPAEDVDLILVATSTSENVFPCTACEVQRENHAEPVSYTHLDVYKRQLIYLTLWNVCGVQFTYSK